jgi:hypothetical protein
MFPEMSVILAFNHVAHAGFLQTTAQHVYRATYSFLQIDV